MTSSTDKVTRFDAELVDSAIAEGGRQNRTGRQQLEYWARIGRAMTAHETASLHRVHEALAGTRELSELTAARAACSTGDRCAPGGRAGPHRLRRDPRCAWGHHGGARR